MLAVQPVLLMSLEKRVISQGGYFVSTVPVRNNEALHIQVRCIKICLARATYSNSAHGVNAAAHCKQSTWHGNKENHLGNPVHYWWQASWYVFISSVDAETNCIWFLCTVASSLWRDWWRGEPLYFSLIIYVKSLSSGNKRELVIWMKEVGRVCLQGSSLCNLREKLKASARSLEFQEWGIGNTKSCHRWFGGLLWQTCLKNPNCLRSPLSWGTLTSAVGQGMINRAQNTDIVLLGLLLLLEASASRQFQAAPYPSCRLVRTSIKITRTHTHLDMPQSLCVCVMLSISWQVQSQPVSFMAMWGRKHTPPFKSYCGTLPRGLKERKDKSYTVSSI